jgi:hypothetical protein
MVLTPALCNKGHENEMRNLALFLRNRRGHVEAHFVFVLLAFARTYRHKSLQKKIHATCSFVMLFQSVCTLSKG